MTTSDRNSEDKGIVDLARVVEIYGADENRWPADKRLAFAEMRRRIGMTDRKIREERALDTLLDKATAPTPPPGAVDRIVQAALTSGAGPPASADVITLPRREPQQGPKIGRSAWHSAAGLIAASMMLGMVVGTTQFAEHVFSGFADAALSEDAESDEYALDLILFDLVDEEGEP